MFSKIEEELSNLNILNRCEIEIGLLDQNTNETILATILNLDGTTESVELPVDEVVYLTEYGTITFPARRFLETLRDYISMKFDLVFDEICDGCFNLSWSESQIIGRLKAFEIEINAYIKGYLSDFDDNLNFLNNILEGKKELQSIVDLSALRKYITCKISVK